MGDDTWMTVFPDTFQPNMSFPYDSFNVEDLHTVDEGVIQHLFPLLLDKNRPFDFLIGHFLGVDHVGHRVGPDHPSMRTKLEQMNQVLTHVVELLEDDTLLVVLGDHGMDRTGDHGGDGELETSAGLWVYSKGPEIAHEHHISPSSLLRNKTFPGTVPSRFVQQIDLVPTLSLLLGLPIPFNNLGTVIPEFFWRDDKGLDLTLALEINAAQIRRYLNAYRASVSGGELDDAWPELQSMWDAIEETQPLSEERLIALHLYTRFALETCRYLWAQFNPVLMGFGLTVIGGGVLGLWALGTSLAQEGSDLGHWFKLNMPWCLRGIAGGAVLGLLSYLALEYSLPGVDALDCVLFTAALVSCLVFITRAPKMSSSDMIKSLSIPLILHTLAFLSNSFTFWEDRIVPFLLLSSIVPFVLTGFTAPTTRLRNRILGFSFLFAVCVRLIAMSTVCREEQQPYCHVTFFASSSIPSPPLPILILALPASFFLPRVIRHFLGISKSDRGVAKVFLPWILRPTLILGTLYWLVEWADTVGMFGNDWTETLRRFRTATARSAMGIPAVGGTILWWSTPTCLEIDVQIIPQEGGGEGRKQVTVLGFANALGAPYLIFWTLFLSIVYTTTLLTGQVVLALGTVALLAYLEVVDSVRDVKVMQSTLALSAPSAAASLAHSMGTPPTQLTDIVPLALLGLHIFYGTGHQSVISTIQWKSAFLLTPTVTYPLSPLTVLINSFGPQFLVGVAAPLLSLWNRAPFVPALSNSGGNKKDVQSRTDTSRAASVVLAGLGMMMYYASLLFGSAVSAAILRRHLMVWKVFAPRFMCAVIAVLVVDVAVLFGVGVGVAKIEQKVEKTFGHR